MASDGAHAGNGADGPDETEPLHVVCSADAPEDEAKGKEDDLRGQEPKAVFGLPDASVAAGHPEHEPVAKGSGVEEAEKVSQCLEADWVRWGFDAEDYDMSVSVGT